MVVISREKKKDPAAIELRNVASGTVVRAFGSGEGNPNRIEFSPTGKLVAVINGEVIHVFDVASGDAVAELKGHSKTVYRAAFSDDESQLTSFADDRTIRVWSLETGFASATYQPVSQYVFPSGNGTCLAALGSGLSLIDLEHEPPVEEPGNVDRAKTGTPFEIPDSSLRGSRLGAAHFVPGGTHVITTAQDGAIRFWKLPAIVPE